MYKYPHNRLIVSLVLAYGNNRDKINEVLRAYELPELTVKTAIGYYRRAKSYTKKDSYKDLVLYYKQKGYIPAQELLAALRVVGSMQLRCIINSSVMLGNKLDGAPDLLIPKELDIYKHYFFDITGWTNLDWNDYKREVAPYEKNALQYALEGKVRDLMLALQLVPSSTDDEMLRDVVAEAYKEFKNIKRLINDKTPAGKRAELVREAKIWADMMFSGHRARMAGHGTASRGNGNSSGEDDKDDLPPFRLIYIDKNGNLALEKTREELEAEMKQRLEADELRYKALADNAAGGNANIANGAKTPEVGTT